MSKKSQHKLEIYQNSYFGSNYKCFLKLITTDNAESNAKYEFQIACNWITDLIVCPLHRNSAALENEDADISAMHAGLWGSHFVTPNGVVTPNDVVISSLHMTSLRHSRGRSCVNQTHGNSSNENRYDVHVDRWSRWMHWMCTFVEGLISAGSTHSPALYHASTPCHPHCPPGSIYRHHHHCPSGKGRPHHHCPPGSIDRHHHHCPSEKERRHLRQGPR